MAAWLHAAGCPAGGEAQFPALKAAVLALSRAQLEGAWSELSLSTATPEPWPQSPQAAWVRFVHASAVITGVAGCSRLPGLQAQPSPGAGTHPVNGLASGPATAPAAQPDPRIVEPEGGTWPHRDKADWTEAERSAMQAMRKRGMTDAQLAAVVGCSRQRVGQLIGSKIAARLAAVTRAKLAGHVQERP